MFEGVVKRRDKPAVHGKEESTYLFGHGKGDRIFAPLDQGIAALTLIIAPDEATLRLELFNFLI